jgi:hypothetical protein
VADVSLQPLKLGAGGEHGLGEVGAGGQADLGGRDGDGGLGLVGQNDALEAGAGF